MGLSSSAALCVALALALYGAAGTEPPRPVRLARLCSRVESEWAGQETGLLDQLASLLGEEGRALRLDMRTLEARTVELDLHGHVLATLDSGASRSLAASGYNERREECRRALELLGLESLRDADDASGLPAPLDRRLRHVISENERVDAAVAALESGELAELGRAAERLAREPARRLRGVGSRRSSAPWRPAWTRARSGRASWAAASAARCSRCSRPAPRCRRAQSAFGLARALGFSELVGLLLKPPTVDRRLAYKNLRTGLIAGAIAIIVFALSWVVGLVY